MKNPYRSPSLKYSERSTSKGRWTWVKRMVDIYQNFKQLILTDLILILFSSWGLLLKQSEYSEGWLLGKAVLITVSKIGLE